MLDLEAIKAGCEAATPGPWVNTGGRFPKINGGPIGGCDVATLFFADGADAAFIAAAREDVPALVAEVERLQNDVADALDVRAGHGPTALATVVVERDALRGEIERLLVENEQLRTGISLAYDAARGATREACALVCEAEGRQHPGVCQVFANILATLIRDGDGVILSKRADP